MKLHFSFLENDIEVSADYVRCLEIENKNCFFHIVDGLNKYSKGIIVDDLFVSEEKINNLFVFVDYFNFNYSSKKMINGIQKIVKEQITDISYDILLKNYRKILSEFKKIIGDIDINLSIDEEINLDGLIKLLNIEISYSDNLLKNILLLIDIYKLLGENCMLIFINIKQYLTKEELKELYKYAIYNSMVVLLIDNYSYGISQEYEKKIIIDEDLEEFVL